MFSGNDESFDDRDDGNPYAPPPPEPSLFEEELCWLWMSRLDTSGLILTLATLFGLLALFLANGESYGLAVTSFAFLIDCIVVYSICRMLRLRWSVTILYLFGEFLFPFGTMFVHHFLGKHLFRRMLAVSAEARER